MHKRPFLEVAAAIGAMIALYAATNLFLIRHYYYAVIHADESIHLAASLDFYRAFKAFFFEPSAIKELQDYFIRFVYPPFFYICVSLVNIFIGFGKMQVAMGNLFFVMILFVSTYCLGKKLSGEYRTGLYAAFICGMYPMIFSLSGFAMLDLPLTAMVTLCFCSLVYADGFESPRESVLFGICLGLALFTKWTAPFFIAGPFIYAVIRALSERQNRLRKIRNISFSLAAAALISNWWYVHQITSAYFIRRDKLESFCRFGTAITERTHPFYTLEGISFYARTFFPYQLSLFFSVFFLFGLILFLRSPSRHKVFLFAWIILPYALLTLIISKSPRYIMPVLPAMALITAMGIRSIRFLRLRNWLVVLSVCIGIAQYCLLSFVPSAARFLNSGIGVAAVREIFYSGLLAYKDYFSFDWLRYYKNEYRERGELELVFGEIFSRYKKQVAPARTLHIGIVWPSTIWGERTVFTPYPIAHRGEDIEVTGFYENHKVFIDRAKLFDLLVLKVSGSNWPLRQEMVEDFNKCNIEAFNTLKPQEIDGFLQLFLNFRERYLPVEMMKIGHGSYVYILLRKGHIEDASVVLPYYRTSAVLEKGKTRLIFNDGYISVSYAGKNITANEGFFLSFVSENVRRDNLQASWNVESATSDTLVAVASWPDIPIKEVWRFGITENSLQWQAELVTDKEVTLKDLNAKVSLDKEYIAWSDYYEDGRLLETSAVTSERPHDLVMYAGVLGLDAEPGKGPGLPSLVLDIRDNSFLPFYSLYRVVEFAHKDRQSTEFICYSQKKPIRFQKGSQEVASLRIDFFPDERQARDFRMQVRPAGEFGEGEARFFFDAGKIRIFWEGKELTAENGLYFQIKTPSGDRLTTGAYWDLDKESQNKLVARLVWPDLPVIHHLTIQTSGNTAVFSVETELLESVPLQEESFVVMLNDAFDRYLIPELNETGEFPSLRKEGVAWDGVWGTEEGRVSSIAALNSQDKTGVTLSCVAKGRDNYSLVVSNTNKQYGARALVYAHKNTAPPPLSAGIRPFGVFSVCVTQEETLP